MEQYFEISGTDLQIFLPEEVDHFNAEQLRKEADRILQSRNIRRIVFDFSRTQFMDSSGIGMILGRYRKLGEKGLKIAISGCSPSVRNILNMAGVFSIIDYYQDREEAVREMNRKEVS